MTQETSRIELTLPGAAAIAEKMAEHLAGHGGRLRREPGLWRLDFGLRRAEIEVEGPALRILAHGADASLAEEMRMDLAEHLAEFGGPVLPDWSGRDGQMPPNFRLMRVAAVRDVTPLMRRIRLEGAHLLRFTPLTALHVKLVLPPGDAAPVWPRLDAGGHLRAGNGILRKYTIRRIDAAAGWLEVDVVRHHPPGPASAWAMAARPGDEVGLFGPGGGGIPLCGPSLLAGDETALPAILRALEAMPDRAGVAALIEVAGPAEEQPAPADARLRWLHRGDAAPGARLAEAVIAAAPGPETYVWAGCEFAAFRAIRTALRGPMGHPRDRHLVTAYWRAGLAADRMERRARIAALLPGGA